MSIKGRKITLYSPLSLNSLSHNLSLSCLSLSLSLSFLSHLSQHINLSTQVSQAYPLFYRPREGGGRLPTGYLIVIVF